VLVEPVLSYASYIWGSMAFKRHLPRNPYGAKAEKVQNWYSCIMTGVGQGAALDVVYRDLHRLPAVYHWVALAVRLWNCMQLAYARAHLRAWHPTRGLRMPSHLKVLLADKHNVYQQTRTVLQIKRT
jgi:hypothetical protein